MPELPLRGRPGQFVLLLGGLAVKVGLSRPARRLIRREARNNLLAQGVPQWRGVVVPVSRLGAVLLSRRHPPALPEHEDAVAAFIEERLAALAGAPRRPAPELMDLGPLDELSARGLEAEAVSPLRRALAATALPGSAAHGDFFAANMVWRDGCLALIDWDSYRAESSFLFDALHYYLNRRQAALGGKSWTLMVFEDFAASPEIRRILERLGVAPAAAARAYALDRLSREIVQEGGVARLAPAKLEKYLTLCRKLAAQVD